MRPAPGALPPRPLSCKRSRFLHSPWRWPKSHQGRSFLPRAASPSPTHTPSHGYPRRPVVPQATGLSFCPKKKAAGCAPPFVHVRTLVGFGAELVVAGAAGLASVTERCGHRGEVTRARGSRKLVVG